LSNKICEDAPQVCFESAADFGGPITQKTIDGAESFSKDRFDRVSKDLVEKVRDVVDSQGLTTLTFTLLRPIHEPRMG
jgi:hypothetical protein